MLVVAQWQSLYEYVTLDFVGEPFVTAVLVSVRRRRVGAEAGQKCLTCKSPVSRTSDALTPWNAVTFLYAYRLNEMTKQTCASRNLITRLRDDGSSELRN